MYKGYVDDPRNTDNAWMETVAVNFHDESGKNSVLIKHVVIFGMICYWLSKVDCSSPRI